MEFKSREDAFAFMKRSKYIGGGSQGECYTDRKNAYKFYFSFLDPMEGDTLLTEEEILRFSDVESDMFIFPQDVMRLNNEVIGDVSRYVNAINLYKINPLTINLNRLLKLCEIALKEIELISRQNIKCHDIVYNVLLGEKIYVVDTLEYFRKPEDYEKLLSINTKQFNLSILWFLIDGLFEEVIEEKKILQEMYDAKGEDISIIEFITELKKYLSELIGQEVTELRQARKLINKEKHDTDYERQLIL